MAAGEPAGNMTVHVDLALLRQRESEQVEWKENVADADDVVATLCAFANDLQNLGGGYVVCGARETRDPAGFAATELTGLSAARLRELEPLILARCRERVSPSIAPLVAEVPTATADRRVLVFIQPCTAHAHTFRRGKEAGRYLVRIGRSTVEARNGVLRDLLVRKGETPPWDRRANAAAVASDLDLLSLRDAVRRLNLEREDAPADRFLSDSHAFSAFVPPLLVREPLTGVLRPRNFALALFGREPQHFIPGAVAYFSRYAGRDRATPVGQRMELAGTLVDQLRVLMPALEAEAVTLYDKRDTQLPSVLKYPARALREAVVNAFAHRDYERTDPLRVTSFADRIEVSSPGPAPLGVDAAQLASAAAPPVWRNQALAWFLARLGFAEGEGQGLQTIARTMAANGNPPAQFEVSEARVLCALPAHGRAGALVDPA
ncbi:MAG: putative DNA binding domain-containing protein [Deltaproteobacteria bacterium]|nr:putative DNA binding domain-containing protein [Deltaproteobacteria bacterium]